MSQQQILLLILSIVVVGMTVYMSVAVFDRLSRKRHADILMNHAVQVAADAAAWRGKTSPFLGGGNTYNNISMENLLLSEERIPGKVRFTHVEADSLEITAVSDNYSEIGIRVYISGPDIVDTKISYEGEITFAD